MRRHFWIAPAVAGCLFVLDRLSRTWLYAGNHRVLVPHLLESNPVPNTGFAFGWSLPSWALTVSLVVLMVVVAAFGTMAWRRVTLLPWWGATLAFTGAVSNILDRLHFGYVRDVLTLSFLPTTGNVGDWMVTVGATLLLVSFLRPFRPPTGP